MSEWGELAGGLGEVTMMWMGQCRCCLSTCMYVLSYVFKPVWKRVFQEQGDAGIHSTRRNLPMTRSRDGALLDFSHVDADTRRRCSARTQGYGLSSSESLQSLEAEVLINPSQAERCSTATPPTCDAHTGPTDPYTASNPAASNAHTVLPHPSAIHNLQETRYRIR